MKNLTHLLFILLALVLTGASQASAYDFYTGGIYYGIGSGANVEVQNKGTFNTYSGNVTIPSSVTYGGNTYNVVGIGYQAFKNCTNLTGVTLPNSLTMLLNEAFRGCTKLTTIVIPSGVTAIYNNVFQDCTGLTSIYVRRKTPTSASTNNFSASTYSSATLFVPEEAYDAYKSTAPWSSFTNIKKTNYDFEKNGIYYKITNTSARTVKVTYRDTNYDNYSGSVSIPSSVTYDGTTYTVTAIGAFAFRGTNDGGHLTSVTIPSTVTEIENYAFWLQKNLGNVTIPTSVKTIGDYAFCWCSSMTYMYLPSSVTTLGKHVFSQCKKLENVVIGVGITKIDEDAFYGCEKLVTVNLHNYITTIAKNAFQECTKLTTVNMGASLTSLGNSVFNGCPALKYVNINAFTPPTMTSSTFDASHYSNVTVTVPYSSKSAYQTANYWKNFTTINARAYDFVVNEIYYRRITSNTAKVTYRDTNYDNYSGYVSIPASVSYAGTAYTVTKIGEYAFRGTNDGGHLTSVTIPSTVTEIEHDAFWLQMNLGNVTIPTSVKTIGDYAFCWCSSMTSVEIPNSVTTLGAHVFSQCKKLERVVIGTGVTAVNNDAFYGCEKLKSVDIPDNVTLIGANAFQKCTALESVTIGSGVSKISTYAFDGCSVLKTVTCVRSTPPVMSNSNCFDASTYSRATLYVPGASVNNYKSADWWRMFSAINSLPYDFYVNGIYYKKTSNNTVAVTYKDSNYNSYSGTVNIPASISVGGTTYKVTKIGDNAFWQSKDLTAVTMPSTVTEIGSYAFCLSGLKSVVVGSGVKTIGNLAFDACTSLKSVTLPEGLTTISAQAFMYCTALTSVVIPNSVTEIGTYAFNQCNALKTLTLGSGLQKLGNYAISQCEALTTITSLAKVPPTMASSNCFSTSTYNNANLYVPKTSLNAYKSADWWRMFIHITGADIGADPSDVNGDGEVNISDVNALIDAILKGWNDSKYDANCDGEVNISDVNAVIDVILKG